jgi:hypothetical protein
MAADPLAVGTKATMKFNWYRACVAAIWVALLFSSIVQSQPAVSNQTASERAFGATDRERFEQGIAMLKAYYDALEGRLGATVAFFVGVVGWLITSSGTREALSKSRGLTWLAALTLTLLVVMYALNAAWWVHRWAEIRSSVDALHYVEPQFYARYDLPRLGWVGYVGPVALLYVFIVGCLIMISTKRFV